MWRSHHVWSPQRTFSRKIPAFRCRPNAHGIKQNGASHPVNTNPGYEEVMSSPGTHSSGGVAACRREKRHNQSKRRIYQGEGWWSSDAEVSNVTNRYIYRGLFAAFWLCIRVIEGVPKQNVPIRLLGTRFEERNCISEPGPMQYRSITGTFFETPCKPKYNGWSQVPVFAGVGLSVSGDTMGEVKFQCSLA
jgi:hypothetical protein